MDRRDFLRTAAAAGFAAGMGHAHGKDGAMKPTREMEYRTLGRTGEKLSMIGFGGIIVMNQSPEESADYVAEAVDRGVTYFDVAPGYGNAEERLGPALEPYRDRCFLACKTARRDAAGAREELERSLQLLRTDYFDVYQIHGLLRMEEAEQVFAPGGAFEVFLEAKEQGKARYLGFSAHSEECAAYALDHYDFDTILFPFNYFTWEKGGFGPDTYARARERDMGLLALKTMAHQHWPGDLPREERPWQKCWYEPLDSVDKIRLALRWTLNRPVHAMLPPGHYELFRLALDLAQSEEMTPLTDDETSVLAEMARTARPIFEKPVAA